MKNDLTHSTSCTSAEPLPTADSVRPRPDDAENVIQLVVGEPFPISEHASCIDGSFDIPAWTDLALVVDAITSIVASVCGKEKCKVPNTPRLIKERPNEIVAGAAVYLPSDITTEEKDRILNLVGLLFHLLTSPAAWHNLDLFDGDKLTLETIQIVQDVLEIHRTRKIVQPIKITIAGHSSQTLHLLGRLVDKPRSQLVPASEHCFVDGIVDVLKYSGRAIEILTKKGKRVVARFEISLHWKTLIALLDPPTFSRFELCETVTVLGKIEFVLIDTKSNPELFQIEPQSD